LYYVGTKAQLNFSHSLLVTRHYFE
jgi:hypothetical protein